MDFIRKICEEAALISSRSSTGTERLTAISNTASTLITITTADIALDGMQPICKKYETPLDAVRNEFYLNYNYNYAKGQYDSQKFCTGTDNNLIETGVIGTISVLPTVEGTGYTLNDILTITTGSGDATVKAIGVEDGAVTTLELVSGGTSGYTVSAGNATSGGTGSGCQVEITALTQPYQTLCSGSQTRYNKVSRWEFNADWIRTATIADAFIKVMIWWLTYRRWIFEATLMYTQNALKLEIGDKVKINHSLLPVGVSNTRQFIVTRLVDGATSRVGRIDAQFMMIPGNL
jgi:hypothetical protein